MTGSEPEASSDRTAGVGTTRMNWGDAVSLFSIGGAILGVEEGSRPLCRSRRWWRSRRYSQPRMTIAIASGMPTPMPTPMPILADVGKPLWLGDVVGVLVSAAELTLVIVVAREVTKSVMVRVDVGMGVFPLWISPFMKTPCPARQHAVLL